MTIWASIYGLLAVFAVFLFFKGVRIVNQQTVVIVESFGKYVKTLKPGLNFLVPIFQTAVGTLQLRVTEFKATVEVKTHDNVFVSMPVSLMLQIVPERAQEAFYQLLNPSEQIAAWALNTLRSTVATMKLSDVYEDQQKIASEVEIALKDKLEAYGYRIVTILVEQPRVPAGDQDAFNGVVSSQRNREAAENDAEAKRIRMIGEAKAESESQVLRAKGIAEARGILAKSLEEIANGTTGADKDKIMSFMLETNRLDTIRAAAEQGKMIIMDVHGKEGFSFQVPSSE